MGIGNKLTITTTNYINGNYLVRPYRRGMATEKICLHLGEEFSPEFPDSIDIKLTNYCTHGCSFCHESSSIQGKHGNLSALKNILIKLPRVHIELALGGGNALEHPDLIDFIDWCIGQNFSPRLTITEKDLDNPILKEIEKRFIPIGLSIYKFNEGLIEKVHSRYNNDVVYHVIIGVYPVEDLEKLTRSIFCGGILVLGFKQFGRAKNQNPQHIDEWRNFLKSYIYKNRLNRAINSRVSIAFDNLAIEQLGLKNFLLQNEWDKRYFGSEFSSSMYIDAVEQTFAPTSRSEERISWSETDLLTYFKNNHNAF